MKRIILATAGVAVVAVFAATLGSAQPTATTGRPPARRRHRLCRGCRRTSLSRQRWIVGVKCDAPPFGYLDVRGKNAGSTSRSPVVRPLRIGREQRLTLLCAPTAVREPLLTAAASTSSSRRSPAADRDTRIDFSRAYYKATGGCS